MLVGVDGGNEVAGFVIAVLSGGVIDIGLRHHAVGGIIRAGAEGAGDVIEGHLAAFANTEAINT